MCPRSGGEYTFLSHMYGPAVGFMAGWLPATVGFAAPVALAAMAFGQYAEAALPGAPALPLGLAAIGIVSAVHLRGSRHSSVFQVGFTVLKLALIVVSIGVGFTRGGGQPIGFVPGAQDVTQIVSAGFAVIRLRFARCERLPVAGSRDRAEELAGIPLRECPP